MPSDFCTRSATRDCPRAICVSARAAIFAVVVGRFSSLGERVGNGSQLVNRLGEGRFELFKNRIDQDLQFPTLLPFKGAGPFVDVNFHRRAGGRLRIDIELPPRHRVRGALSTRRLALRALSGAVVFFAEKLLRIGRRWAPETG